MGHYSMPDPCGSLSGDDRWSNVDGFWMEGETQQQQGETTIQRIVRRQVSYALFLRQMKSLQHMKPS